MTCEHLALRSIPFVVALIGSQPYGPGEVARFVGAPTVVELPVDPWAAAVLAGRTGSARRFRRSPLQRALGAASATVAATSRDANAGAHWDGPRLAAVDSWEDGS